MILTILAIVTGFYVFTTLAYIYYLKYKVKCKDMNITLIKSKMSLIEMQLVPKDYRYATHEDKNKIMPENTMVYIQRWIRADISMPWKDDMVYAIPLINKTQKGN